MTHQFLYPRTSATEASSHQSNHSLTHPIIVVFLVTAVLYEDISGQHPGTSGGQDAPNAAKGLIRV